MHVKDNAAPRTEANGSSCHDFDIDIHALIERVLRECYLGTTDDLRIYADKVQFYIEVKKRIREELKRARDRQALEGAVKPEDEGGPLKNGPLTPRVPSGNFVGSKNVVYEGDAPPPPPALTPGTPPPTTGDITGRKPTDPLATGAMVLKPIPGSENMRALCYADGTPVMVGGRAVHIAAAPKSSVSAVANADGSMTLAVNGAKLGNLDKRLPPDELFVAGSLGKTHVKPGSEKPNWVVKSPTDAKPPIEVKPPEPENTLETRQPKPFELKKDYHDRGNYSVFEEQQDRSIKEFKEQYKYLAPAEQKALMDKIRAQGGLTIYLSVHDDDASDNDYQNGNGKGWTTKPYDDETLDHYIERAFKDAHKDFSDEVGNKEGAGNFGWFTTKVAIPEYSVVVKGPGTGQGGPAGAAPGNDGPDEASLTERKPGQPIETYAHVKAYIKELEDMLNTVGDDAQLANVDLQKVVQDMQQTLQKMSNLSKGYHDTCLAIIRKLDQ